MKKNISAKSHSILLIILVAVALTVPVTQVSGQQDTKVHNFSWPGNYPGYFMDGNGNPIYEISSGDYGIFGISTNSKKELFTISRYENGKWSPLSFKLPVYYSSRISICLYKNDLFVSYTEKSGFEVIICRYAEGKWQKVGETGIKSKYSHSRLLTDGIDLFLSSQENNNAPAFFRLKEDKWIKYPEMSISNKCYSASYSIVNNEPYILFFEDYTDLFPSVWGYNGSKWQKMGNEVSPKFIEQDASISVHLVNDTLSVIALEHPSYGPGFNDPEFKNLKVYTLSNETWTLSNSMVKNLENTSASTFSSTGNGIAMLSYDARSFSGSYDVQPVMLVSDEKRKSIAEELVKKNLENEKRERGDNLPSVRTVLDQNGFLSAFEKIPYQSIDYKLTPDRAAGKLKFTPRLNEKDTAGVYTAVLPVNQNLAFVKRNKLWGISGTATGFVGKYSEIIKLEGVDAYILQTTDGNFRLFDPVKNIMIPQEFSSYQKSTGYALSKVSTFIGRTGQKRIVVNATTMQIMAEDLDSIYYNDGRRIIGTYFSTNSQEKSVFFKFIDSKNNIVLDKLESMPDPLVNFCWRLSKDGKKFNINEQSAIISDLGELKTDEFYVVIAFDGLSQAEINDNLWVNVNNINKPASGARTGYRFKIEKVSLSGPGKISYDDIINERTEKLHTKGFSAIIVPPGSYSVEIDELKLVNGKTRTYTDTGIIRVDGTKKIVIHRISL